MEVVPLDSQFTKFFGRDPLADGVFSAVDPRAHGGPRGQISLARHGRNLPALVRLRRLLVDRARLRHAHSSSSTAMCSSRPMEKDSARTCSRRSARAGGTTRVASSETAPPWTGVSRPYRCPVSRLDRWPWAIVETSQSRWRVESFVGEGFRQTTRAASSHNQRLSA